VGLARGNFADYIARLIGPGQLPYRVAYTNSRSLYLQVLLTFGLLLLLLLLLLTSYTLSTV